MKLIMEVAPLQKVSQMQLAPKEGFVIGVDPHNGKETYIPQTSHIPNHTFNPLKWDHWVDAVKGNLPLSITLTVEFVVFMAILYTALTK